MNMPLHQAQEAAVANGRGGWKGDVVRSSMQAVEREG